MSAPASRRTKVLATVGPATADARSVLKLIQAGADGIRINASHGRAEHWRKSAENVRHAADIAGRPVALLFDLSGPKIRLSSDIEVREIASAQEVHFTGAEHPENGAVQVRWPELALAVAPGRSEIIIGDGTPRFSVTEVSGQTVRARCERPGTLRPSKGVFVTHAETGGPALTEKDLVDLDVAVEVGAEFVAQSFVRTGEDVLRLREELEARGSRARIVAKIEKTQAVDNLEDILANADGLMVARGDLGVEVGAARVPLLQKEIISRATAAGKLVITATQMLESMLSSPEPTRAEASDITNAILDGTSALMLSGETAVGDYPSEAVEVMAEIAREAQMGSPFAVDIKATPSDQAEAVMQSATYLAEQIDANALVIPTATGGSARAASKYRPGRPIIALAEDEVVTNQLALEWGVVSATLPGHPGAIFDLLDEALWSARAAGRLNNGDTVVVTYGQSGRIAGGTDLIAVRRIGAALPPGAGGIDLAMG
jgi:pyruvate kinase